MSKPREYPSSTQLWPRRATCHQLPQEHLLSKTTRSFIFSNILSATTKVCHFSKRTFCFLWVLPLNSSQNYEVLLYLGRESIKEIQSSSKLLFGCFLLFRVRTAPQGKLLVGLTHTWTHPRPLGTCTSRFLQLSNCRVHQKEFAVVHKKLSPQLLIYSGFRTQ